MSNMQEGNKPDFGDACRGYIFEHRPMLLRTMGLCPKKVEQKGAIATGSFRNGEIS